MNEIRNKRRGGESNERKGNFEIREKWRNEVLKRIEKWERKKYMLSTESDVSWKSNILCTLENKITNKKKDGKSRKFTTP